MSAKKSRIFVTGLAELDAKIKEIDLKITRKAVLKALRVSANMIKDDIVATSPVDTGAMRDSFVVRAPKRRGALRSRQSRLGPAMQVRVDGKKLYAKYTAAHGGDPPVGADGRAFFYPAMVELGGQDHPPTRWMSKSLYGNQDAAKAIFLYELRAEINKIRPAKVV